MKRIISAVLLSLMLLSLSSCDKTRQSEKPNASEPAASVQPLEAPAEPAPEKRDFPSPEVEALIVTAESFLARRQYIQYDDTRLINSAAGKHYRFEWTSKSPEDYTKQFIGYTNCACFTYDLYLKALDFDIKHWYVTPFFTDEEMMVYSCELTGSETPEQRAKIEADIRAALAPGDLISLRHIPSGAHVMFYAGEYGNGFEVLHSTYFLGGGNYDYDNKVEKTEPKGTFSAEKLSDFFDPKNDQYFFKQSQIVISRPLNVYHGTEIPENTRNRADNLQGVSVSKLCSHTVGQTVDLGEEMTFEFEIKNSNPWTVTLSAEDSVPEHTSYVSGAETVDGSSLSWIVKVAPKSTETVSYTVKVDSDEALYNGAFIFGENAKIGGVSLSCPPVYVGRNLKNADKVTAAIKTGTENGMALACKAYAAAGTEISLPDEKTLLNSIFVPAEYPEMYKLNTETEYKNIIVPTMFGGFNVVNDEDLRGAKRTRTPLSTQLSAGDIVVCGDTGSNALAYYYCGKGVLIELTGSTHTEMSAVDSKAVFDSLIGFDRFVIIRPSLGF